MFCAPYEGEIFLCGGAFKPILDIQAPISDLDLWVRTRRDRDALVASLEAAGAILCRDFHPYCIKFEHAGFDIEVNYQNVKDRHISEIVHGFDIAACSIAATYRNGLVTGTYFSRRAYKSIRERKVMFEEGYLKNLRGEHPPTILRGLDRMERFARATGYRLDESARDLLWKIYETEYDAAERRACIDTYLLTTVDYKGLRNVPLLRRAQPRKLELVPERDADHSVEGHGILATASA